MTRIFLAMLFAVWMPRGFVALSRAEQAPEILNAVRIEPSMGATLPMDSVFRDHEGGPLVLGDLFGERPVVLCLVYFDCPMLCKLAADGLVRTVTGLSETVGQDFDVMLVSFNPVDTPERAAAAREQALGNYARDGAGAGWHFLTGSQESIDALTSAVGFRYVWDDASKQFAHASGLTVISPSGVITGYLDGVQFSPRELITAIDHAERNQVSSTPPTSFVRCYLYDPTTGKFGAAVQWTVRVLGFITVVAIVVLIARLARNEPQYVIEEGNG